MRRKHAFLTILAGGGVSAPAQPTGLTATPVSTSQIDLAWTDVATNETAYKIYRSTDGVSYAQVGVDQAAGTQAYSDTTISAGTTYYYKVAAVNAGGETLSTVATANTLTYSLIGYWKLNETSDGSAPVQRVDSKGSLHLTDTNNCPSVAGKLNNAVSTVIANSERLASSATTVLAAGTGVSFEVAGWAYRTSGATQGFFSKQNMWGVGFNSGANRIRFSVRNGPNSAGDTLDANAFGAPPLSTWMFIHIWHDAVNDVLGIRINDQYEDTKTHTDDVFQSNSIFYISFDERSGGYLTGYVDNVQFWQRVLTAAERTANFNSGAGLELP